MRRTKHTFKYSHVKVSDKKTGQVLVDEKVEGKVSVDDVVVDYIKKNGYNPNLEIKVEPIKRTFVMSAEDYMKYGEEIVDSNEEQVTL